MLKHRFNPTRLSIARGLLTALCMAILMPMQSAFAQQLSPVWVLSTIAGNGTNADSGDGGPAASAHLGRPNTVLMDKAGNLYFSEAANFVVRKIDTSGVITTVAGTSLATGSSGDGGPAVSALLGAPYGLAIDNNGNLLIADEGNHKIRKVDVITGIITTIAGTGTAGYTGDGGPATLATLNQTYTIASDRNGNIYTADYSAMVIRKIDTTGTITTIAGTGTAGYTGDGGPALQATVSKPWGLWADMESNLYISDYGNNVIRVIDTTGNIRTIVGTGIACPGKAPCGDGGPATSAQLNGARTPVGDGLGNIFIPDENDETMRWVNSSGVITTIAGITGKKGSIGDGGPATLGETDELYGSTVDSSNNITFNDNGNFRIRRLSLNNGFPATAVGAAAGQNLFLQSATALTPQTAAVTPAAPAQFTLGTLAGCSLGASLAANTPCTVPVTFNPTAPGLQTAQLAFTDASGNVSTVGLSGVGTAPESTFSIAAIRTIAGNGTAGNTATQVSAPRGGVVDSTGNIYFADSGNNVIRRIDAMTGAISTIAGTGTQGYSGDGAAANTAQLNAPAKVVVDAANNIYIADTGNNVIRFVNANTGFISTIAGTGTAAYTGDGGAATAAALNHPQGLAVDLGGHVYVADTGNHVIRYFGNGGLITTLTGTGTAGYAGDGGNAMSAQLNAPQAVALDQKGSVYIADTGNDLVRVISATNQISTLAGQQGLAANTGDGAAATTAKLNLPSDLVLDAAGDVYIASGSQVRMVNTAGIIATLAGSANSGSYSGEGGGATSAVIPAPASNLMLDNAGDIVMAATAANRLLKISSATPMALNFGVQTAGTTSTPTAFSVMNAGNSILNLSGIAASAGYTLQTGGASACTTSSSLTPGQSCTISLAFSPAASATGSVAGTLTLTDNALNGTGVQQTFVLSGSTKVVYDTATTLSVSPSPLVYGSAATVTATVNNGSSATGTINFTVNGTSSGSAPVTNQKATITLPGLPAGAVNIGASYTGDADNNSSSTNTSFTVQPAVLTVTATNATVPSGGTPVLTYAIAGFVNGDAGSVVSGAPAETTPATMSSPQGTYSITIAQGTLAAPNYTFAFVAGTLTVGPPASADYTLAVTPSSTSVTAGQTGMITLTLTPLHGYKGTVALSCGSLPANVSCAFAGPLTGDGLGTPAYTQVTIYTNGHSVTARNDSPFSESRVWLAMGMPLCCFGLALCRGRRRWTGRLLSLVLLAAATAAMSSCSQGGSGAVAAAGTYQVVVTAADTSANLSHSATFTLTIQ